ncbi:TPA: hypothetical protein ACUU9N_003811 [Yersinia enterocolitica]|uniref:hypothetical protein n=1 Tax=Yersinia enterocolitica TaxID=630 RepID=UPI00330F0F4C|nr:hypothetical protein [Yersinia enterocolitica]
MKYTIATLTILFFVFFLMLLTFYYFPSAFKDVKITDYISSVSSTLSLIVAFYAFLFAKDYLGQERGKNASKIAIDIIQKDVKQLSKMSDVFDALYTLEQNIRHFHKSTTPEQENECIKIFSHYQNELVVVMKGMDEKYDTIKYNILSASIVGCKIRKDVEVFNDIFKNYQILLLRIVDINRVLSIALEFEHHESIGQFINPGKVEEHLPELNDSITRAITYYKKTNADIYKIQNELVDLDDLFIFK